MYIHTYIYVHLCVYIYRFEYACARTYTLLQFNIYIHVTDLIAYCLLQYNYNVVALTCIVLSALYDTHCLANICQMNV